jgi:repressor of nif and glnA expression
VADGIAVTAGAGTTVQTSDRSGVHIQHILSLGSETIAATHVTVTNSSTEILAARAGRRRAVITNYQTVPIYVGQDTITTSTGHRLDPGTSIVIFTVGIIDGITSAAYTAAGEDDKVHVLEEYD